MWSDEVYFRRGGLKSLITKEKLIVCFVNQVSSTVIG